MKTNLTSGLLFLILQLSISLAYGQLENISLLDRKVTIAVVEKPISAILDTISGQANVFFSYDAKLIEAESTRSISLTDQTIRLMLDSLFNSRFTYKTLGDQIIIGLPDNEAAKLKEPAVNPTKSTIIAFRGKVIDRDEKDILPYANILIFRKNIGTVSNNDGDFVLKIPESMKNDTIIVSCLGYRQHLLPVNEISDKIYTIALQPSSVQLKEIQVTVIYPEDIISKILSKISLNYSGDNEIMTSFYREVLKQDSKYIDVAEALMEIRKSPYDNPFVQDKTRVIKGRKSLNVKPFQFVDFKIQGGPYYITKLDVVKTIETFLDPEFREFYKYTLEEIVEIDNRVTYVIHFKPREKVDYPCYQGKLYVDMSSFALVRAEFSLSRSGLKFARESLIRKKPKDLYVRPISVDYKVSYRKANSKWHLNSAQASLNFRVRSKQDKVNSVFRSDSDLLITDFKTDNSTRFKRDETFNSNEIFTEVINTYDDGFWGDYNIIQPSEELRKSLQEYSMKNDTLFPDNKKRIINHK